MLRICRKSGYYTTINMSVGVKEQTFRELYISREFRHSTCNGPHPLKMVLVRPRLKADRKYEKTVAPFLGLGH